MLNKKALQIVSKMQSNLYQKCMQNCAENVCKNSVQIVLQKLHFLCIKKVLQSDANEHFTYVSSRARKQTNKQTNKQKHLSVLEKRYIEKTRTKRRILGSHSFPFLANAKTKPPLSLFTDEQKLFSPMRNKHFSSMSKTFFIDEHNAFHR